MKNPCLRTAAIHDISGFGRASLTVIIPVLSSMGIQVCPIPTAVLSSHSGGFHDYKYIDLTEHIEEYIEHWKSIGMNFDCIYSGFLSSPKQIDILKEFISYNKNDNQLVVIDPVMGDGGSLYSSINKNLVKKMKEYIKEADIITPNFTEACLLLDEEFKEDIDVTTIKKWLKRLSDMGPEITIITSVPLNISNNNIYVIAYDKKNDKYWKVESEHIPAYYPGTGDIFCSVIVGSILKGDSLPIAISRATEFVYIAVKTSYSYGYPNREGVLLEKVLHNLGSSEVSLNYEMI